MHLKKVQALELFAKYKYWLHSHHQLNSKVPGKNEAEEEAGST